eukprot:6356927-Amphidinium_carterae.1
MVQNESSVCVGHVGECETCTDNHNSCFPQQRGASVASCQEYEQQKPNFNQAARCGPSTVAFP